MDRPISLYYLGQFLPCRSGVTAVAPRAYLVNIVNYDIILTKDV
jgi:hypothetical protein